jgi:TonB-dependent starch-binding outer membrane protein SusC
MSTSAMMARLGYIGTVMLFFFTVICIPEVRALDAQQTVTGQVRDAGSNEPLPGVNVIIDGTARGTATDGNGQYSLEIPGPETVLVFSFVGYTTERVAVEGRQTIDVTLRMDMGRLDEVIVVGYGTVQRSDLTGSVERITAAEFQNMRMTQATEMLTGTVTGLYSQ